MAFQFCLFLIFAYHLVQRYAEAVPIENGVGIPIILAVDPPMAPNGTTISPAEQHDFEEILNNSTISAIAADASNSTGTSAELSAPSAAVQMNAASVNITSSNGGEANNDVPAPERGNNANATKSEAAIVATADSEGGGKTTNGPISTTTTTTTISTTAVATEEGAPSAGPLVEIAANPPAAPVPAADTVPKNEAPVPPPAQMSLQAINVSPKNSNSGENLGPSTPRSPSNFAQLPMFEAQQTCTSSDCNGNGNCIGIRGMPLCMCNAGYTGSRCQMEVCDPSEDCNGRGWCVGTKTQFTCFCQLGYSGNECQNENNNGR